MGLLLAPGSLPHWSPLCHCGSSLAGPREEQQVFRGFVLVKSARPNLESDMDKITNLGFFFPHVLLLYNFLIWESKQSSGVQTWVQMFEHQRAKEEENNFAFLIVASYLHWLECGWEGILKSTACKSPHLLRKHGASCHENIPAKRHGLNPETLLSPKVNCAQAYPAVTLLASSRLPPLCCFIVKLVISTILTWKHQLISTTSRPP